MSPVADGVGLAASLEKNPRHCSDFEIIGLQKAAQMVVSMQQQQALPKKAEECEGFTRSISLYWHWVRGQKAASKMGKGLSRSNTALILQCEHWLEAADPKHRYGTNLRPYFDFWLEQQSKARDGANARHSACIPYSAIPEIAAQAAAEAAARPAAVAAAAAAAAAATVTAAAAAADASQEGGLECSCELPAAIGDAAVAEAAAAAAEAAAAAAAAATSPYVEPDDVMCTPRRSRSAPNLADAAVGISEEECEDSSTVASEEMADADPAAAPPAAAAAAGGSVQASQQQQEQQQQTPLPPSSSPPADAGDTRSSSKQQQQLRWQDQALGLLSSPSLPVAGHLLGPATLPGIHTDDRFFYWLDEGSGRHVCLSDRGVPRSKLECERVQYLTGAERAQLEVTVDREKGLLVYRVSGQMVHTGSELAVVQLRSSSTVAAAAAAAAAAVAAVDGSSNSDHRQQQHQHQHQQQEQVEVEVRKPAAVPAGCCGGCLPSIPEGSPAAAEAVPVSTPSVPAAAAVAAAEPSSAAAAADEWEEEEEEASEEEPQQHGPFTPVSLQRHEQRQRQREALKQLQQDIWQRPGSQQQQQQYGQLTVPDNDVHMTDADVCTPDGPPAAVDCKAPSRGVLFACSDGSGSSTAAAAAAAAATPTAAAYGAVAGLATPGTTGLSQRRFSIEAAAAAADQGVQQQQCNGCAPQEQQQQQQALLPEVAQQQQQQLCLPHQLFGTPANGNLQSPQQQQQQQAAADAAVCNGSSGAAAHLQAPAQQQHRLAAEVATCNGSSGAAAHLPPPPPAAAAAAAAAAADPAVAVQEKIKEKPCKWIYVLDTNQRLFVHAKYKGKFHHSSFLQGGAVLSAGGIVVENGRILKLTADSGHYRPNFENFMSTVQLLKDWGADLTQTKLSAKHIKLPDVAQ